MYRKNVRLLSIFNFLIGFTFFAPLAIIYFAKISGSYTLGTSIFGVIMLSAAIFEVPTGILSDRVGRRSTMIYGSWVRGAAFIFYAIGLSYWFLVVGAILEGVRSSLSFNGNTLLFPCWSQQLLASCLESLLMGIGENLYLPDTPARIFWKGYTD